MVRVGALCGGLFIFGTHDMGTTRTMKPARPSNEAMVVGGVYKGNGRNVVGVRGKGKVVFKIEIFFHVNWTGTRMYG